MLWTIYVILFSVWFFAASSGNTFGGFIHILLVIAISVLFLRAYQSAQVRL
jgi:hypothetical protein